MPRLLHPIALLLLCSTRLHADGIVACWGRNDSQQCDVPAKLASVTRVSAAELHTIALHDDGTLSCWGSDCALPSDGASVRSMAAGYYHAIALLHDGTVACWGSNGNGQCDVRGRTGTGAELGQAS